MYGRIQGEIRWRVEEETDWSAFSCKQQQEMDLGRVMLREAADQGHMYAQVCVGQINGLVEGVAKDLRLSLLYTKKAGSQGHALSQYNAGFRYGHGEGCKQNNPVV